MKIRLITNLTCSLIAGFALSVAAGPLDPECTAGKAAKSTAAKATVGVGGRCSPKEAATDTAKRATDADELLDKDKKRDDDEGLARKAAKKAVD